MRVSSHNSLAPSGATELNIVCVGDCGADRYLPSGEQRVGGITANVARGLRLQLPADVVVQIVSCVGDDPFATRVIAELENVDIDCHIERARGTTPIQEIRIREDGEKQFTHYDEGVLRDFAFNNEQRTIIEAGDMLIAPVYQQIRGLFERLMAIETRASVYIDFADFAAHPDFGLVERFCGDIDIGFFGLSIEDTDSIDRIARSARNSSMMFVVTLAEHGSRVYAGSREYHCPARPIDKVVDTTGAGDAYAAGFIASYMRHTDIRQAMSKAARLAHRAIAQVGSFHGQV